MTDLKSLLPEELETFFGAMGESAYRARQVFQWIHEKDVSDFAQMTNLPAAAARKAVAHIPGHCGDGGEKARFRA